MIWRCSVSTDANTKQPGLIFRWPGVSVVVLMFFSGKVSDIYLADCVFLTGPPLQVVLTGARSIADIEEGWRVIWLLIKQFVTKRQ